MSILPPLCLAACWKHTKFKDFGSPIITLVMVLVQGAVLLKIETKIIK